MEPAPRPPVREPPATTSPAERTVAALGERYLVERLHRVLDDGGIAAHRAFCEQMLPYVQELVALLPRLVRADALPTAIETVRTLGSTARQRGVSARDAIAEGIELHDRLRQDVTSHDGHALIIALGNLSRALLEVGRDALPAQETGASVEPAPVDGADAEDGLASWEYFEERFGEEILRAQRSKRPLTLILLDVTCSETTPGAGSDGRISCVLPGVGATLVAQTRGIDLVVRVEGDEFAILLPEAGRAGAAAVLNRLAQGSADQPAHHQPMQLRAGIAVYPNDGKTIHELMQYARNALSQAQSAV